MESNDKAAEVAARQRARQRALVELLRQPMPPRSPCWAFERFLLALLGRVGGAA